MDVFSDRSELSEAADGNERDKGDGDGPILSNPVHVHETIFVENKWKHEERPEVHQGLEWTCDFEVSRICVNSLMEAKALLEDDDVFEFLDVRIVSVTVIYFISDHIIIGLVSFISDYVHWALKHTLIPDAYHLSLSESIVEIDPAAAVSESELVLTSEFPTSLVVLGESVRIIPLGT